MNNLRPFKRRRTARWIVTAVTLLPVSLGSAVAQGQRTIPMPPPSTQSNPQSQQLPPREAATGRVFLDSQVEAVYVETDRTVAVMSPSDESDCPSNEYVFERNRPQWLRETGRLLVAQEQAAVVRISFTCYAGAQSINAIQFLTPPGPQLARGTPSSDRSVGARSRGGPLPLPNRASDGGTIPVPGPPSAAATGTEAPQGARPLPLPR